MEIKELKEIYNIFNKRNLFSRIRTNVVSLFYRFFYIVGWIPRLWNNYWWDHSTLDAMLIYELRYRANRFRNFGMCESADAIAEEMDLVADALDDYHSNRLQDELAADWEKKYPGFLKKTFEEFNGQKSSKKDETLSKLFVKEYVEVENKQSKMRREALMLLAEKSENWWD